MTLLDTVGKSEPRRVQLSRKAGWRMPENTVKVSRPGKWGNPYRMFYDGDRQQVIDLYRAGLMTGKWRQGYNDTDVMLCVGIDAKLGELRGKNLACWCKLTDPCHADVLLELANPLPSDQNTKRAG